MSLGSLGSLSSVVNSLIVSGAQGTKGQGHLLSCRGTTKEWFTATYLSELKNHKNCLRFEIKGRMGNHDWIEFFTWVEAFSTLQLPIKWIACKTQTNLCYRPPPPPPPLLSNGTATPSIVCLFVCLFVPFVCILHLFVCFLLNGNDNDGYTKARIRAPTDDDDDGKFKYD